MTLFKKRETIVQNITYMAIMSAINVIFVLFARFLPLSIIFLVFLLPLSSSLVALFCKKRYYPIYFVATILLCFLMNIENVSDLFFYVLPSLLTGFVFGFFLNKRLPGLIGIIFSSFIQMALTYLSYFLLIIIYDQDLVNTIVKLVGLSDFKYVSYLKTIFIFLVSFIQEMITYTILKNELKKIINFGKEKVNDAFLYIIIDFMLLLISLLTIFIFPEISYCFMIGAMIISFYLSYKLIIIKKAWIIASSSFSFILTFLLFVILYSYTPIPKGFIYFNIFNFGTLIIALINNCLLKERSIVKM